MWLVHGGNGPKKKPCLLSRMGLFDVVAEINSDHHDIGIQLFSKKLSHTEIVAWPGRRQTAAKRDGRNPRTGQPIRHAFGKDACCGICSIGERITDKQQPLSRRQGFTGRQAGIEPTAGARDAVGHPTSDIRVVNK